MNFITFITIVGTIYIVYFGFNIIVDLSRNHKKISMANAVTTPAFNTEQPRHLGKREKEGEETSPVQRQNSVKDQKVMNDMGIETIPTSGISVNQDNLMTVAHQMTFENETV